MATARSTRRLSEVARHLVIPDGIVTTGWPEVERQCREFGDTFDEWQRGLGSVVLGKDADGIYTATIGGVTLSIPRQVAKTFIVGRLVFALCVLFPGLRVVWTAHRTRTATQTFRKLAGYAERAAVKPYVADVRKTNGEQEIMFTNGSTIMFGAREQGFGRGFDELDILVFDEAQILTEKALEDMVPATNQSRHPHGALIFYMGTPPRPVDPGEVFTARRQEALSGESEDAVYIETSADEDADPDDRTQWAIANPSFPLHTPLRSMLRMRKNLQSDDSWRREALGIWDRLEVFTPSVISPELWRSRVTEAPPADGALVYGIKFSPDGRTVALAVGLRPDAGPVHVEGIAVESLARGTTWLVDWVVQRHEDVGEVIVDGKSGAAAYVAALVKAGVPKRKVRQLTTDQVISAHVMLLEAVVGGTVTHLADPVLAASVGSAGRRRIGTAGGWGFESVDGGDVTLAESVVLAHFGAASVKRPRPRGHSGRRAVVL